MRADRRSAGYGRGSRRRTRSDEPSHRDDNLPSCMSVLDIADCGRNLAQRESAVDHRSNLSTFAEFLQHQQVSLVGLHQYVSELLAADRKQWSEQQGFGQLAIRPARHRVAAVGRKRTPVVPNGTVSVSGQDQVVSLAVRCEIVFGVVDHMVCTNRARTMSTFL